LRKNLVAALIGLLILSIFAGCTGPKEEAKTPEQIAEEGYRKFEKEAIETAKEFVLATQGDKEKIKELSFPTLLKHIEEKNWSIMLVEDIKLKNDSFESNVEKLDEKQVLVRLFYEGEMKMEGKTIPVKLSSKIGVIEQEGKPVVFSAE